MEVNCKRCGLTWETKFDREPKRCNGCKSPYWKKPLTKFWEKIRDKNKEAKKNAK